jgi:exopolysaccharide production protein ExoQ
VAQLTDVALRKDWIAMQTFPETSEYSATPISRLAVSWVLLIPLMYIAGDGGFFFYGSEANNQLAAYYGALVSDPRRTFENAAMSVLVFGLLLVVLFPRLKAVLAMARRHKVFVILAGWAAVSCLWSQFPVVTLMWAPIAALNVVLAFYLYRRFSPEQQLQLLLGLGWLCLILNIVLSMFFPQYGLDYEVAKVAWRGMCSTKNLCSMTTSFLLPAAFYAPAKSVFAKVSRVVYVGLSILVIFMTQSATGEIGLAALLAFVAAMGPILRLRNRDRSIALVLGATTVLALVVTFLAAGKQILLLLNRDPTLTGRTEIWESIIPAIMQHPILGYGYQAFWRGYQGASANIALSNGWAVSSAHNSFLQIGLDLGLVGMALVAYTIVIALRNSFLCLRTVKSPYLTWCTCIVLITIVTTADEVALMVPNSPVWLIYMLACIGLSEAASRVRLESSHG